MRQANLLKSLLVVNALLAGALVLRLHGRADISTPAPAPNDGAGF